MKIKGLESEDLIVCMCEGAAEKAIMNILLDNNRLVFTRSQLVDEEVIMRISVERFEERYLRQAYDKGLIVLRVIDSRNEAFTIKKVYRHQIKIVNVITAPEIEILVIVSMGMYGNYCKSGIRKPSDYCKSVLKLHKVKSEEYITNYFSSPDFLIKSIKEYHRVHKQKNDELSLYDLIIK